MLVGPLPDPDLVSHLQRLGSLYPLAVDLDFPPAIASAASERVL